ncbi:MaoC family dehydratase [Nocardia salmonicida]|uniref:MaoC family dehydratase n=1 Tax=Nocardia salmonicida TaxID=53431 RepID=UPI00366AF762
MLKTSLSRLTDHLGSDLGHSNWIKIEQERINAFAEVTEDRQWIHTDSERAADGPFGNTIAHGYLTLSLVSVFLFDLLIVEDAGSIVNYGLNRVRFPSYVPVEASIRAHGQLIDVTAAGSDLQTVIRMTIETDRGAKPGMVADVLTRFQP